MPILSVIKKPPHLHNRGILFIIDHYIINCKIINIDAVIGIFPLPDGMIWFKGFCHWKPVQYGFLNFIQQVTGSFGVFQRYTLSFRQDPHKKAADNVICISYHTFIFLRRLPNTSSCVILLLFSAAARSASSSAASTPSVSREYMSRLRTTIAPYPFLVRYTGSPSFTSFSMSRNLFLRSETGLICIIHHASLS